MNPEVAALLRAFVDIDPAQPDTQMLAALRRHAIILLKTINPPKADIQAPMLYSEVARHD